MWTVPAPQSYHSPPKTDYSWRRKSVPIAASLGHYTEQTEPNQKTVYLQQTDELIIMCQKNPNDRQPVYQSPYPTQANTIENKFHQIDIGAGFIMKKEQPCLNMRAGTAATSVQLQDQMKSKDDQIKELQQQLEEAQSTYEKEISSLMKEFGISDTRSADKDLAQQLKISIQQKDQLITDKEKRIQSLES